MYICICIEKSHTGRDNSQTHQLQHLCASDLRLGLRVSRRDCRFLPTTHILSVPAIRREGMASCLSPALLFVLLCFLGLLMLSLLMSQVQAETLALHSLAFLVGSQDS